VLLTQAGKIIGGFARPMLEIESNSF